MPASVCSNFLFLKSLIDALLGVYVPLLFWYLIEEAR
jgi:hypothetical protein